MEKRIYISYSWKEEELLIADTIDKDWQALGVTLIRDKRDVNYKSSLKDFMSGMSEGDYVLVIIGQGYLKSKNCMFEALELFKDKNFKDKILSILAPSAKIHSAVDKLDYVLYWEAEIAKLNEKLRLLSGASNLAAVHEELDHYTRIRAYIDNFSGTLSDMRSASWPDIKQQNYEEVFKHIGYSKEESNILKECDRIINLEDEEDKEIALDNLKNKFINNKYILFAEATVAYENKKYKKSKHCLLRSIAIDPNFWQARSNLSILLMEHFNDFEAAEEQIEAFLKYDSVDAEAYSNAAFFFREKRKNYTKSKELSQTILKTNPNHIASIYNLASISYSEGNYEEAKVLFERLLIFEPLHERAHAEFALLLSEHFNAHDISKQHFEKALSINPEESNVNANYAVLLSRHFNDYENAIKHFNLALSLTDSHSNNSAYIYANYGVFAIEQLKDYEKARHYFEQAITIKPNHEVIHYNLARLLSTHLRDYDNARKHFEIYLENNPNDITANIQLALLLIRNIHDYNKARAHFEHVLQISPNDVRTHANLALLLIKYLNDPIQAQIHHNKACELDPRYRNPETAKLFIL